MNSHSILKQNEFNNGEKYGLLYLMGVQKKLLFYFFSSCKKNNSHTTEEMSIDRIGFDTNIKKGSIKTSLKRLIKKGFIKKVQSKRGKGGWIKFELPDNVYQEIYHF